MCNAVKTMVPPRPTHQVIAELAFEHHELCGKIDRLNTFIKDGALGVSPEQVKYLHDQLGFMRRYAKCLNLRMKDLLDVMSESSDSE